MIKAKYYSAEGKETGELPLSSDIFSVKINDSLLWEYVKTYLTNQRQGTAKGKGRSEVSGGGKKPWKQKGTGNARAGTSTSPLWVRGGKVFHPQPLDHRLKIPKKKKRLALRSALSLTAAENRLKIIDGVSLSEPKTKQVINVLRNIGVEGKKNLLVVNKCSPEIFRAVRNIKNLDLERVQELNAYSVLQTDNLLMVKDAFEYINKTVA
jgi:large subunit ribosomal protein L4